MPKKGCKTTSINIENNLYLMAIGEGIEMSAFVNRCLAIFFEVPENPHDKLVKEKSQYAVLRLKEKYEREVREVIKEHAAQTGFDDAAKAKEADLIMFGEYLQKTSAYPVFKNCLQKKDIDDDVLRIVTSEVNRMNGRIYQEMELWNRAVDWYKKYGMVTS